jgi:AraC family transcriptional regulator
VNYTRPNPQKQFDSMFSKSGGGVLMSNAKFIPSLKQPAQGVPMPLNWQRDHCANPQLSTCHQELANMPQLRLNRVIAYVESHLASDLSLSRLADVAGMSAFYFCRAFKQSTGITPHRYVLTRRMEQAKRLLETNGVSLLEIAEQVGFSDQSQFTRVFHRLVGTTPAQFRKGGSQAY